jgi:hypothetical protein
LLECVATYRDDSSAVAIVTPDGRHLDPADAGASDRLSALVDRPVRLAFARGEVLQLERANPEDLAAVGDENGLGKTVVQIGMGVPGGFFDAFPIHFTATASLRRIAEVSIAKTPEPARFRPNIVFDSVGLAFAENGCHGALICVGRDLGLRVAFPTPRCAVPTLAHGANAPDPRLTVEIDKINEVPVLMGPVPAWAPTHRSSAQVGSPWETRSTWSNRGETAPGVVVGDAPWDNASFAKLEVSLRIGARTILKRDVARLQSERRGKPLDDNREGDHREGGD